MNAIELGSVSVRLGDVDVVDRVEIAFPEGQWTVVIGPNGAGKTSLLRAVAGLLPCTGTIELFGRPLRGYPRRERARVIAVVPQSPVVPPWMTVAEYVLLGRTPYHGPLAGETHADVEAAERAIVRLDLGGLASRQLGTLSGGECQRAVVARALAQEAPILLLDEPTSALDIGHQQHALELVDGLRREIGLTLVAAMHDLTLAAQFADRLVLLDRGRVCALGTPHEVLTEERLAAHYDASVHVLDVGGRVAVVPRRPA